MAEQISALMNETVSKITKFETRSRKRNINAQLSFEHAVRSILIDLWKSIHSIPIRECSIN